MGLIKLSSSSWLIEESLIIKVVIIFNFYLSSNMRDERYYQRLNQIREKYGYLNDINPEQDLRKMGERREHMPSTLQQPPLLHHYLDDYQLPKQQSHNAANALLQARRAKENNSTPPQAYLREVATERISRPSQNNQTRYPLQKRDLPNPPEYSPEFSSAQNGVSKEFSSPIKRLQLELSNPNTPNRNYSHSTQRPKVTQVSSTRNSYRTTNANLADRSQPFYDTIIEDLPQSHYPAPPQGLTDRSLTSTPLEDLYKNREKQDFGNKYNASLNNIDKLQERIQAMLSKPKK